MIRFDAERSRRRFAASVPPAASLVPGARRHAHGKGAAVVQHGQHRGLAHLDSYGLSAQRLGQLLGEHLGRAVAGGGAAVSLLLKCHAVLRGLPASHYG